MKNQNTVEFKLANAEQLIVLANVTTKDKEMRRSQIEQAILELQLALDLIK